MKLNKQTILIIVISIAVGIAIGGLVFNNSSKEKEENHQHSEEQVSEEWTCSMHPQIRQSEAGQCPICGMDLIPVDNGGDNEDNPMSIKMSPTAMQLANVQTEIVVMKVPVNQIRLDGKVQANEKLVYSQTTHISGRVEELFINTTGESVTKGQTIALIYSPELVTAQKELFEAEKIKDSNPELFVAAKEKLKNWKFTNKQIQNILSRGKPTENFPILSDVDGIVLKKNINLGDHITQGHSLFEIADLSEVWVLFDVYESEMPWVNLGDEIEYTIQSLPDQFFKGTVEFIDPVLNPKTRVAKARVVTKNKGLKMKPEMFVSGSLSSPLKEQEEAIILPKSSIMWTGKKSVVYVKSSDKNGISFLMRKVTLGASLGDNYIIQDGLEEGEEVATHGTFSIDAAAQLSGKPSMMNPEGGASMTGHNHGGTSTTPTMNKPSEKTISSSIQVKEELQSLFTEYFSIHESLANDEYQNALGSVSKMSADLKKINMSVFKGNAHNVWMDQSNSIKELLQSMNTAENIEDLRMKFSMLSEHMISLAYSFRPVDQTMYVQYCSMANNNSGANWLSINKKIHNPYYGSAMQSCGETIDSITK